MICYNVEGWKQMNAVLAINKPQSITSFAAVKKISRNLQAKAGHSGTLDPMASGVLLVGLNKATKLLPYLMSSHKRYQATITFGILTDSKDITGDVILEAEIPALTIYDYQKALEKIVGPQMQQVPKVSAVKVDGKPLYKHKGKVKLPSRMIEVYESKYLESSANTLTYEVLVSKGTYVRVLSEVIAQHLNTIGTTSELIRIENSHVHLDECQSLEEALKDPRPLDFYKLLKDYPIIEVDDPRFIYHGKPTECESNEDRVCFFYQNQPIAMYKRQKDKVFVSERGLF